MRKYKYKFLVSSAILTFMACMLKLEGYPNSIATIGTMLGALANFAVFIYFIKSDKKELVN